ncbi:UvrD-helicase domain-containing protein [Gordonia rubripertincta]|nr:UvrD-helicase domain-containing protein [Gordonia rubripertincta]
MSHPVQQHISKGHHLSAILVRDLTHVIKRLGDCTGADGRDTMKPTEEQQVIIDAARRGESLVIQAGAGTGKTTTLRQVSESVRRPSLYIAYNRATADEARAKFPRHVESRTMHSLAFQAVGKEYAARLNRPRLTLQDAADILAIDPVTLPRKGLFRRGRTIDRLHVARLVHEAVNRFCISADEQISLRHVPEERSLSKDENARLAEQILPFAQQAWADICDVDGRIRFTHDHYLKIWALDHPRLRADVIMLDEAQDTNPVVAQIVREQRLAQQIVVGDSDQQLYQWRGAVDALADWPADQELYLTLSWRFGRPIAEEANKWLWLLDSHKRLEGAAAHGSRVDSLAAPDAVLCRTNSGTVRHALEQLKTGKKVAIVGGGAEVKRLAVAADELNRRGATSHPELYLFTSWDQVREFADEPAGADLRTFVDLVDRYGTAEIIRIVDSLVSENYADVIISTAHRAKGREWGTVRISDDFKRSTADPENVGKLRSVPHTDAMLAYVAVTRAREALDVGGLAWIDEYNPPAWTTISEPIPPPAAPRPDITLAASLEREDQLQGQPKIDETARVRAVEWSSDPVRTATRISEYDEYTSTNILAGTEIACPSYRQCRRAAMGDESSERQDRDYYPAQLGYIGEHYDIRVNGVPRRILIVGMERGEGPAWFDREARTLDHDRALVPSNRNPHMRGVVNALRTGFEVVDAEAPEEYLDLEAGPSHVLKCYALVNLRLCSAVKRTARGRESAQVDEMSMNCQVHLTETVRILQPTLTIVQGKRLWPYVKSALGVEKQVHDGLPLYLGQVAGTRRLVALFNHPSASEPHGWSSPTAEYFREIVVPTIELGNAIVGRAHARRTVAFAPQHSEG